jgi:hypothetical protein
LPQDLRCPACVDPLTVQAEAVRCPQGHEYTAIDLALATNSNTVKALWLAVRALEDDAAGLDHLTQKYPQFNVPARRREAEAARTAAQQLRQHAGAAQQRLDALRGELRG